MLLFVVIPRLPYREFGEIRVHRKTLNNKNRSGYTTFDVFLAQGGSNRNASAVTSSVETMKSGHIIFIQAYKSPLHSLADRF